MKMLFVFAALISVALAVNVVPDSDKETILLPEQTNAHEDGYTIE